ncbi:type II secretion system protein [Halothermothrix orenii]|uniref:Tfp pilus assembly protein, major pilin PilA n=1 Tax=Halothermothrix orenii (strain H 168 / OCM 544 / DSM 9562) TaxID=373903 RepID=B8D2D0_HALOH|nr:prepilin-type N-terminal cleavage/methylation domain-containing protein [Halothermothrix orenii]ACL69357.1 Tfp pilus assembly protein, major pilin PilA [Halothermothrix orenii H 168]
MKFFKTLYTRESGITLVEILIVIAIIGIFVGIALPRLGGMRERAQVATGKSVLGTINTALGLYYSEYGTYELGSNYSDISDLLNDYIDNLTATLGDFQLGNYNTPSADEFTLQIGIDQNGDGSLTEADDLILELDQNGDIEVK